MWDLGCDGVFFLVFLDAVAFFTLNLRVYLSCCSLCFMPGNNTGGIGEAFWLFGGCFQDSFRARELDTQAPQSWSEVSFFQEPLVKRGNRDSMLYYASGIFHLQRMDDTFISYPWSSLPKDTCALSRGDPRFLFTQLFATGFLANAHGGTTTHRSTSFATWTLEVVLWCLDFLLACCSSTTECT